MLNHLKYFHRAALSGSFSRAAAELFISQPALSRQIASLEEELGLQLFTRQGKKPVLTDAGKRLLVYAEEIMDLDREARKEMADLKDLTAGELLLGASTTSANYLLPPVLAIYRDSHPGIKIRLDVGNTREIEAAVLANSVDVGLIGSSPESPRLFREQFASDELVLVVGKDHRFARMGGEISRQDLAKETFLCREPGSDTRRLFEGLLEHKFEPERAITLEHTEAIKNGVVHNLGISFLSRRAWENEGKLGLMVPVEQFKIERPLCLIYRKDARLSPAALMFTASLKKYYRDRS